MKRLRKLLLPLSPVYAAVVWLRNKAYDLGWISSESFATPVLCVGNLSVGGTGKTPMVEWLVSYFLQDRSVGILSRGYGRSSKGFRWVKPDSRVEDTGDEPLQMARKFPQAHFAVDANRREGIRRMVAEIQPDLIILDDAFQHRRVKPKKSLLLTAWDALYSDQQYLPAGDLRDHRSQAARADLVIVTKCPTEPSPEERRRIRSRLKLREGQPLAFATLKYDTICDQDGRPIADTELRSVGLSLVTGIADPGSLLRELERREIAYDHMAFPDHHRFSQAEAKRIQACEQVLTTAKDAVRMGAFLKGYWVIGVSHSFAPEDRQILEGVLEGV